MTVFTGYRLFNMDDMNAQSSLTPDEIATIEDFAKGNTIRKAEAIDIYRAHLSVDGLTNRFMRFMSEVDTARPQMARRMAYRSEVIEQAER